MQNKKLSIAISYFLNYNGVVLSLYTRSPSLSLGCQQPACPHTLPLSFSLSFCLCNLWLCCARVRDKACLPCTCHMDTNSRDTTSVILLKPKQNVKASQLLIVRAVQLNRRYFVHLKPFSQLISLIQRCPTPCPTIC